MKKIGVLGGSFDPVHNGHVRLAKAALSELQLDNVILMPAHIQPFKQDTKPTAPEHRINMLRLAFGFDDRFVVSEYEINNTNVSYTYNTLQYLKAQNPDAEIVFIMGADSVLKLDKWYKGKELLRQFSFAVSCRPGYDEREYLETVKRYENEYNATIKVLSSTMLHVSATEIREKITNGADCSDILPDGVERYIKDNFLYLSSVSGWKSCSKSCFRVNETFGDNEYSRLKKEILDYLPEHISEKRYKHTLAVADCAKKLAEIYGADVKKAEIAALFHDMHKGLSIEALNALVIESGIDNKYLNNPNLAHSKLAAYSMKKDFGITDDDMINAVSYHTTGRAGMSTLEKIVYLSDAIEPSRNFRNVGLYRELAEIDIDRACFEYMQGTMDYLKIQNKNIDSDTLDAAEYFSHLCKEKK